MISKTRYRALPAAAGSALLLLLAGCPAGQSAASGSTTLTLRALAVSARNPKTNDWVAKVYLSWNSVVRAARYELNVQGNTVPLYTGSETKYVQKDEDTPKEGKPYTYEVRALEADGKPITRSSTVTLTVAAHSVPKPAGDIGLTPSSNATTATSLEPQFSWQAVSPKPAGYYVRVIRVRDTDTTVFGALTETNSVQMGKLPLKDADLGQFKASGQFELAGEGATLVANGTYRVVVQALQADSAALEDAKFVDVSEETPTTFSVSP